MPEISRFYGIVIAIFYNEHNPPHFHARYGSEKIAINMHDVISAKYLDGYKLEVTFDNGKSGVANFSGYLDRGGVFKRFKDMNFFKNCQINKELGVLTWGPEIDIAPETLYSLATGESLPEWMVAEDSDSDYK